MNTVLNMITEPFTYPFMQRALIIFIVTGMVCSVLACYLVFKGWSLMGDTISHAVLPGIVLAFLLGIPIIINRHICFWHFLRFCHWIYQRKQ